MDEPRYFVVGDTVSWAKSLADYPASEWTLTYYFWNESADFSVVATSDNDNYLVSISAEDSEELTAGRYNWKAVVSKGADETLERHTVASGEISVRHNPAVGTGAGIDTRSAVKIALDNIDAVLAKTATREQASYSIAGRTLARRTAEELVGLRNHYARLYAREQKEKRIEEGQSGGGSIHIRFS